MRNEDDVAIHTAYDDYKALDVAEAEKNLMRAILKSALDDYNKSGDPGKESRRYINSDDESYLYSFLCVCHHLGLCPVTVRTMARLEPIF